MRLPSRRRLRLLTLRRITLRLCIWIFAPALLVLLLRAQWAARADRQMQAVRDQLHAQGIRVYLTDFPDGAALPRDQNAVNDLLDAWRLSPPLTEPQWTLLGEGAGARRRPAGPPTALSGLTPADVAEVHRIFAAYTPSIAALDAAASRPQAVWPRSSLQQPLMQLYQRYPTNPTASPGPRLFNLLQLMAKIAYHDNHDEEALLHIRRALSITQILQASPFDNVHNTGMSYRDSSLQLLQSMLPNMDLHSPAAADQAREILRLLQDDSHESRADGQEGLIVRAFERALDVFPRREWWVLTPQETASHARAAQLLAAYLPEFSAASFPQANALRPPTPPYPHTVAGMTTYYLVRLPTLDYGGRSNIETREFWNSVTTRRATAVLLAAHLYTAQHDAPPPMGAALLPDYLPEIPFDPFSSRNQRLHYRNDPTGPTVWSVGEDDHDDTFSARGRPTGDDPFFGALKGAILPR